MSLINILKRGIRFVLFGTPIVTHKASITYIADFTKLIESTCLAKSPKLQHFCYLIMLTVFLDK